MKIRAKRFAAAALATGIFAAPVVSLAETLPNNWDITGITPPETGVVFVSTSGTTTVHYVFDTVTYSQNRNLAAGTYQLGFTSSGSANPAPPADYESLTSSIGGAGSGTPIIRARDNVTTLLTETGTLHTDNFAVTTPGSKAITFSFVGNGPNCNLQFSVQGCAVYFEPATVDLTLLSLSSILPFLPSSTPVNARNVAQAIDPFRTNLAAFPAGFINLFSLAPAALAAGFTQLDGEAGASGPILSINQMTNQFLSALQGANSRGWNPAGAGGTVMALAEEPAKSAAYRSAYAAYTKALAPGQPVEQSWSPWGTAYGGDARVNGNAAVGSSDTSVRTYGAAAGADYRLINGLAGFAIGGGQTRWGLAGGSNSGNSDAFQAGVYGTFRSGNTYLSATASYGFFNVNTDRTVTVAGIDRLHGNFDAHVFAERLELGHRFEFAPARITPYAALQMQSVLLQGYTESVAAGLNQFALSFPSRTAQSTRSELGVWLNGPDFGSLTLFSRLAWAHDWRSGLAASATFQTLPGASFTVNGAVPASDIALVSAGAKLALSKSLTASARFDGEFGKGYSSYAGTAALRLAWN